MTDIEFRQRAHAVLSEVQYAATDERTQFRECPSCGQGTHAPTCELAALVAAGPASTFSLNLASGFTSMSLCCACCGGGPLPCKSPPEQCCVQRLSRLLHPLAGPIMLRDPGCACAWVAIGKVDPARGEEQRYVPCAQCVARAEKREADELAKRDGPASPSNEGPSTPEP